MNYVYAAYLVILGAIGFYAWSLVSRFSRLEKELSVAESSSGNLPLK